MPEQTDILLPDDEHYYFGVELSHSPEEVRARLLRKPEYIYSISWPTDEDSAEESDDRSWLYVWRCHEGWERDMWHLPPAELRELECAPQRMPLRVVLHALTEGEALNHATQSHREALRYILVKPRESGGNMTIPQLNLSGATSNRDFTKLHVVSAAELPSIYEDAILELHEPGEVPQEVIDSHCLTYIRRARTVMAAIHDANSREILLPLQEAYARLACDLLRYSEEGGDEFHRIFSELGKMEYELLFRPWYADSHHRKVTYPAGLVICETLPPGEFRREVLDFEPGRRLCYKRMGAGVKIVPAGEGEEAMPCRDGGRFHIMPEDSVCGPHVDEHGRVIRWIQGDF